MAGVQPGRVYTLVDQTGTIAQQHQTPPRRLQGEGDEDFGMLAAQTGQPTVSGGVLSMNHTNMVANALREEMYAVRHELETKFNTMKVEFDVKMSGRRGTGHYEAVATETLIEKVKNLEQKMEDIEKNMDDIKEVVHNDERSRA